LIGQLIGTVVVEELDGTFVLDVGGVGYEVVAPLGTLGRARAHAGGERITLHVHTHVREDALLLYAFASSEDKAAFRILISVSNVGPKIALALLSAMPADDLASVLAKKDLARLVAVPGVGRKTAERLMLELKDKLAPPAKAREPLRGEAAPVGGAPHNGELLTSALTRMGYRPAEAERAVAQLTPRLESEPLQVLVREALALLAR
jgi:Holliday junction DNA helicase RuvA